MVFLQKKIRCPPIGSSKNVKDLRGLRPHNTRLAHGILTCSQTVVPLYHRKQLYNWTYRKQLYNWISTPPSCPPSVSPSLPLRHCNTRVAHGIFTCSHVQLYRCIGVNLRTCIALEPYARSMPRSIGPSYGRCVSLISSNPCNPTGVPRS